jgi:mannose/cellobiose epimerase-like protein (N-acyl-D-glucosamine 2-epimerase family)
MVATFTAINNDGFLYFGRQVAGGVNRFLFCFAAKGKHPDKKNE